MRFLEFCVGLRIAGCALYTRVLIHDTALWLCVLGPRLAEREVPGAAGTATRTRRGQPATAFDCVFCALY